MFTLIQQLKKTLSNCILNLPKWFYQHVLVLDTISDILNLLHVAFVFPVLSTESQGSYSLSCLRACTCMHRSFVLQYLIYLIRLFQHDNPACGLKVLIATL